MPETRSAKHLLGLECRLCHRIGQRGFVPSGGDNDTWECVNDRACNRRQHGKKAAAASNTVVIRVWGPNPGGDQRPWWARLYYADGVIKTKRHIPVGGQLDAEVTNASRGGLQMDIDAGIKRTDIGRIEWGGPE